MALTSVDVSSSYHVLPSAVFPPTQPTSIKSDSAAGCMHSRRSHLQQALQMVVPCPSDHRHLSWRTATSRLIV